MKSPEPFQGKLISLFYCVLAISEVKLLEDSIAVEWIDKAEMEEFEFAPGVKELIELGFEKYNSITI